MAAAQHLRMAPDDALDLRADPRDRLEPRRERVAPVLLAVLVGLLLVGGSLTAWLWWSGWELRRPVTSVRLEAPVDAAEPAQPAAAPAAPATHYPLRVEEGAQPLDAKGLADAVVQLFGRQASADYLLLDDLPRRLVATLDNLARAHAPVAVWPVAPMAGRFLVTGEGSQQVIAPENAARYAGFVRAVELLDAHAVVKLYSRVFPLLQQAYRDLGFGDRYLNDRVVEVIDVLLATPEPAQLRVDLAEVKGPYPFQRPWVHYQFTDPALESLAAGQKMLLRMGPDNERRLKAKLRELRRELLAQGQSR